MICTHASTEDRQRLVENRSEHFGSRIEHRRKTRVWNVNASDSQAIQLQAGMLEFDPCDFAAPNDISDLPFPSGQA